MIEVCAFRAEVSGPVSYTTGLLGLRMGFRGLSGLNIFKKVPVASNVMSKKGQTVMIPLMIRTSMILAPRSPADPTTSYQQVQGSLGFRDIP